MPLITDLYLLRHGEAVPLVAPPDGSGVDPDPGLSPAGWRQARAFASRRAFRLGLGTLVSSRLARSRQTAEPVAVELGIECEVRPDLHELELAIPPGSPPDAVAPAWDRSRADPDRPAFPGAESLRELYLRAGAALDRLAADHPGGSVLVVTHGGVIEVTLLRLLGLGPEAASRVMARIDHTGLVHLRVPVDQGSVAGVVELVTWNDTRHLGPAAT